MRGFPLISLLPPLFIVLSAAGIVLITLGVRGRPVFASPRCRKCGYDLRNMQFLSAEIGNCPECGVSLATPDAVTFGRWRRQPHRVIWGAVLMVLPWFLALGLVFAFRRGSAAMVTGPAAVTSQSTPALLASLPKAAGSPWEWQELERRLKANQLTTADVDAAFAALATSLNADRAAGKDRQPLHWSGSFIAAAIAANSASQAKVDALCQAYYDKAPPIQMRTRAREGVPIAFIVNVHEPWNIDTLQRCWALTSITVDGATKLTPQEQYSHHDPVQLDGLSGTGRDGERHLELANTLSPGEHELAFAYECGVVSENATFRGIEGRPGQPDKWPATLSRWQTVVKRKIVISPKDQSPLTIITDPSRDPLAVSSIGVQEALVRPASKGVEIVIKWKYPPGASPILSYRVQLQAGGQKIDYGTLVIGAYGRGSVESITPGKRLASLPPDVKSMDIALTPDPTPAEQFIDIDEVWGGSAELKDVPLARFDVERAR